MPIVFEEYLLILVRVLLTLMALVYVVFAGLMSRQIGQMTKSVTMKDSVVITILGYGHLLFAVIVLFLTLVTL